MRNRIRIALVLAAAVTGVGSASAHARVPIPIIKQQRITQHLRVDGSSDLRGFVRVRSGLHVSDGIRADSLATTGPVQIGGILTVAGAAATNGLNAGQGAIVTTAALQGGSLSVNGDANVGGALTVAKTLSAAAENVGASGLTVAGPIQATSISSNGLSAGSINATSVTSGSINSTGAISGSSANFSRLSVAAGGAVNFNNATVSGLTFTGNGTFSSLQIGQGTQAASLSVSSAGDLRVSGTPLAMPSLAVDNSASVGGQLTVKGDTSINGTLNVSTISATNALALTATNVVTSKSLTVGSAGNLQLSNGSGGSPHIIGNSDTRGVCRTGADTGGTNTCSVSFADSYGSAPIVVVTPIGSAPGIVTGYSVNSTAGGFTIYFKVSQQATVTFNYIVEG